MLTGTQSEWPGHHARTRASIVSLDGDYKGTYILVVPAPYETGINGSLGFQTFLAALDPSTRIATHLVMMRHPVVLISHQYTLGRYSPAHVKKSRPCYLDLCCPASCPRKLDTCDS